MKIVLPGMVELAVFAALAVLAATIVPFVTGSPGAIVALMFPMVLTCMLLGARRNGKLGAPATAAEQAA